MFYFIFYYSFVLGRWVAKVVMSTLALSQKLR